MQFLIIGGGSIGKRHIKNLQGLGYQDIFVLKRNYDSEFEKENQVKVIKDISELGNNRIDAVIICTPTSLHNDGIKLAKELKAAIFMEKPLIDNQIGLVESKRLLEGYSFPFFIGFMLRYHPLVKKINALLREKKIGEVYSARFEFGSYLPYWHPWEDYKQSYASVKKLGGGVINTITHELDLVQYFFGEPGWIQCTKSNFGKLGIEVEELAEAVFEYKDKLVSLHIDYLQKDYDRRIRILGDEGSIEWNWHDHKIIVQVHKSKPEIFNLDNFEVNELYVDELKDFLEIIKEQTLEHSLNFSHAEKNTQLMLLMHQSADQGEKLKFTKEI